MRDDTKPKEYYEMIYESDTDDILYEEESLRAILEKEGKDFETIPSCYSGIASNYFLRFYVSYTMGMNCDELLPDVRKCIENGLQGCDGNVYGDLERILYLTIIFRLHEYNGTIKERLVEFKGYQDTYMEHLYHLIDGSFEITAEKLFWQKECKPLFEVIQLAQTDKEAAVQRLKKFVDRQWFRTLKDGIITNTTKCYRGFWCIEAAALVKALALDDAGLKGCKHYPYDMAHFC